MENYINRRWHIAFGWGVLTGRKNKNQHVEIDLEAEKIEVYQTGHGYKEYTKTSGKLLLFVNPNHLKVNENAVLDKNDRLFQLACNCTITLKKETPKKKQSVLFEDNVKVKCRCCKKFISLRELENSDGSCADCNNSTIIKK